MTGVPGVGVDADVESIVGVLAPVCTLRPLSPTLLCEPLRAGSIRRRISMPFKSNLGGIGPSVVNLNGS